MTISRVAGSVLIASMLAGCAGVGPLSNAAPEAPPTPNTVMAGRWMLAAPNAPACGMNFNGAPGASQGTIAPEGGCPGRFFTSRHWAFEDGGLTINDHENKPLAHLSLAGARFEGQSTTGTPVTLTR